MKDFGLYLVMTDPLVGYEALAQAAVDADVGIVQLRMKRAARREIVEVARRVRRITAAGGTLFIVNDDPGIAAEVGADGVHVGQDDMPPSEIRRLYPELKIVGLSTHSPEQVVAANRENVDYIGVGPVYATPTKEIPDPVLGLERMAEMIALSVRPAVAIGGIDADRIAVVAKAGARNAAVVRAVCASENPLLAIKALSGHFPFASCRAGAAG
jgi:thiamine-phosphate pyrophosphorylase